MLVVSYIQENKEEVIEGLKKRNFKELYLIDEVLSLDELRRKTQFELDTILAESNKLSKEIGNLFKSGQTEDANKLKEQTTELKSSSKELQDLLSEYEASIQNILYQIPNVPNELVKAGKDENDNEIVFSSGDASPKKGYLPHWEVAKKYDLIDFELGVKITGAGFPVYKGKGARLQRALIQYFLDKNTAADYQEIIPPFVVNEASGYGTGQLPDKEGQMYYVKEDDLYLIPTSEVPVTNIYRDVILRDEELPLKHTAYSPCFRREAGSYGKDVRGLNRLHQFEKVEIVRIEKPENSMAALDEMVEHVKGLLEELDLPYRILRLCAGDTGFASSITYDFEVFSQAQEKWLEVSSVSNFRDFQANRLKLRYKAGNASQLLHTLNGSALALPRILASILENYQQEDGSIRIPKVLVPYTGFSEIK
ncbi:MULTISPECIES: serine--tRNA ligase [Weeksella]|uniref:Serine--tRNA ligase n=1 Tax=Weeksella virosa (strain ATCC 43766 / DSM 16922 / JCM 21250 / CCUG 30538 / CDC 9751 / IAM 14551 / NBRC 16016 / NCTC 11634 / CL345/78) TaxID=865938 RepID=F0P1X7_WEEVC|nr:MULTISPECIES: serine--tRNA ligase [Weeksella]ADX67687.1 seryl-tRNA synthetase [Weeksella virosa DSM 16922]MDK7674234.1 serine--tRNA ligase [Weeksella virosa]OFM82667.1 serine--tRNA ligase [Weeksella sp. HMSC059D05]SUP53986.1 Serine--tRNA ligase [Weeksella virosa]VEH64686.1 Serine--tRNA ligase [Weeksella virosa]